MCHSLANLEFHHFKYAAHRTPGDAHLHFFGTATLSFARAGATAVASGPEDVLLHLHENGTVTINDNATPI